MTVDTVSKQRQRLQDQDWDSRDIYI